MDSSCFDADELEQYFSYLKVTGIGKKTTIGLGQVEDVTVSQESFEGWDSAKAVMALGRFIPKSNDPCKGYYQLETTPSRGLDGQIYPKITKVQARSVFFPQSPDNMPRFLGKCSRVKKNNRLVYGLSPVQYIEMENVA